MAMEKRLQILRMSLKCSVFTGLQAASREKASAPLPGFGQEQTAACNRVVYGARCKDVSEGVREPEEVLLLENLCHQWEHPYGLMIKSGKSNQVRQDWVAVKTCQLAGTGGAEGE